MSKERAAAPLQSVVGLINNKAQELDDFVFRTYYDNCRGLSDRWERNELITLTRCTEETLERSSSNG